MGRQRDRNRMAAVMAGARERGMAPELLESCRDATGPERRHLRVMGQEQPLCGTVARQDGAGAGRFSDLLRWPTCARCHALAEQMGPHPRQADAAPVRFPDMTEAP